MKTLYGSLTQEQFQKYKDKLHSKIFWLILYKDPETNGQFEYVDYDKYFISLMDEINGLNDILMQPPEIVELMSVLQAAYNQTKEQEFVYSKYRKYVLDAHAILDKMGV